MAVGSVPKAAAAADRRFRSSSRRARSSGLAPCNRDSSRRRSGPSAGSYTFSGDSTTGSSAGPPDFSAAIESEPVPKPTAQKIPSTTSRLRLIWSVWSISSVWSLRSIWLVSSNHTKTDRIDQIDKTDLLTRHGSPIHPSTMVFNRIKRTGVSNAIRSLYPNN